MEKLIWEQNKNNVFVSIEHQEKKITFKLDEKILLHLIGNSPKIFYFSINIQNSRKDYLADFGGLKPIIKSRNKLKVSMKSTVTTTQQNKNSIGKYTIARGESFYERFLGVKGWQTQEYLFDIVPTEKNIVPVDKNITEKETKTTVKIEQIKVSGQAAKPAAPKIKFKSESKNKFVECGECGNIIASELDICPHCFALNIEVEKDIDLTI